MKKILGIVMVSAFAFTAIAPANAKPVTVFQDAAGDAGLNGQLLAPMNTAGFDITGGTIDKVGKDLVFTVTHSEMPATNQPGEAFRFLWHFDFGKTQYRFTVKSFDIGKPDVVAQSGTERVGQIYANGVARLESGYIEATPAVQLAQFAVEGYYDVTFDAAAKTVSWKLPLADLKARPGSVITPGTGGSTGTGCQICWIPHYAERSLTPYTIIDAAYMATSYKIPR
ncbi:MAG: hypothetical protein M3161_03165 [Actinomycetota bacterium]|nr:hypothetical protein [Actinomycetota bacterium]